MTHKEVIKVIGMAATVVSMAASLISDWVDNQKMDALVEEKVNEVIAKNNMKKEEL